MEGYENLIGIDFWTALFTLCNMIITFLVLKKFLFKPVKSMIESRQKEIDGLYADAADAKQQAEAMQAEYQARISQAKAESERLLQDAARRAQNRSDEILDAAGNEARALMEKAQADIALERKKALNAMKDDISGVAVSIAEKVVGQEVRNVNQEQLISDFIDQLGE